MSRNRLWELPPQKQRLLVVGDANLTTLCWWWVSLQLVLLSPESLACAFDLGVQPCFYPCWVQEPGSGNKSRGSETDDAQPGEEKSRDCFPTLFRSLITQFKTAAPLCGSFCLIFRLSTYCLLTFSDTFVSNHKPLSRFPTRE